MSESLYHFRLKLGSRMMECSSVDKNSYKTGDQHVSTEG